MKIRFVTFTFAVMFSFQSLAGDPFDTCPSKAFIAQGTPATLYGVNLVSGGYQVLTSDLGTTGNVNGFGFSVHDRYFYGWDYGSGGLVRIGDDYQVEQLSATGYPPRNFYVGDVAVTENAYYFYRRGTDYGLYRISLDASDPTYLQATRIIDGGSLFLLIADIAFHPTDSFAYTVDSSGNLFQINGTTGGHVNLGNVDVTGSFGAVYFDVNGFLYISRNEDGHIFRINVSESSPTAIFFAAGPISGQNDGARCATAEIFDDDDTSNDYGDAPNSYLTNLMDNGARHEIGDLFLGTSVSGEATPNDPDTFDDGVSFVTGLESGFDTLVSFTASKSGYIHGWIDFNSNGSFDDIEKVVDGQLLAAGETRLLIAIPETAVAGNTWSRFRLSDSDTLPAFGGTVNGEVEDYEVSITEPGVTTIYYPSDSSYVTLAFEDKWPELGDYDFNDFVVEYRTQIDKIVDGASSTVKRYIISGNVSAIGADYHNGFAVRIQGLLRSQVNEDLIRHEIDDVIQPGSALEVGRTEAILMVVPDALASVNVPSGCQYFRTEYGCTSVGKVSFKVSVPLNVPVDDSSLDSDVLDPFIFAVNNKHHGPIVDSSNGRAWEVHLKNQAPTEAFDTNYFNQNDDASDSGASVYFQTSSGLPFGLEIGTDWSHPTERTDIIFAYPSFVEFAESNGLLSPTWFDNSLADKVISD